MVNATRKRVNAAVEVGLIPGGGIVVEARNVQPEDSTSTFREEHYTDDRIEHF